MRVSQKDAYAIKALYALAENGREAMSIPAIGKAQAIPTQFLQVIMREMRQAEFVSSRRGKDGGYTLAQPAEDINLASIVTYIDGPLLTVDENNPNPEDCPIAPVWEKLAESVEHILGTTTLADLVLEHRERLKSRAADFVI